MNTIDKHANRRSAAIPRGAGKLGKYIIAGILTALLLAVFLTGQLQAPTPAGAQNYDDVPTEHTFLSTTMTVGRSQTTINGASTTITGYSKPVGTLTTDTGSLTSNEFTYLGTTYSITILASVEIIVGTLTFDSLNIAISPKFPSTLHSETAVQLNDSRFLLSEADLLTDAGTFGWSNHGLTWT